MRHDAHARLGAYLAWPRTGPHKHGVLMNLSAPTMPVFIVSVILAVLALASYFVFIPVVTPNAYWFALRAYVVLFVGNVAKGL